MCVGASMMALKELEINNNIHESEIWAEKSINAFNEFEKLNPTWYNINYFSSQSYAIRGEYDKAEELFLEMFKKQNSDSVDKALYDDFFNRVNDIKKVRLKLQ